MKHSTILLALVSLSLSACLGREEKLEIVRPPADKLVCPDEPGAPARTGPNGRVTDEAAGRYMGDLRKSWQGCKADVDWLRAWYGKLPK